MRSLRRRNHHASRIRPSGKRRLLLELLESRRLLASIVVTSLADNLTVDGQLTLREALVAANTNTSVDGSPAGEMTEGRNLVGNGLGDPLPLHLIVEPTLAPNGGNTLTHALVSGSRAIDRGGNDLATTPGDDGIPGTGDTNESPLLYDQRGAPFSRIIADTVDIGAVEFEATVGVLRDFGDAPTAAQSGFAQDYPVTLAQEGARHATGTLHLGSSVDSEVDGMPAALAGGDATGGDDHHNSDDEDGISAGFSWVTGDEMTISSYSVTVSEAGKLDAWIDFNQDGDWSDPNEQIATSTPISPNTSGATFVAFVIPGGALPGYTAARFRLSTAGGLTPRGPADNGEVEDHWVYLSDGNTQPDVKWVVQPETSMRVNNGNYVYETDQRVLFQAPTDNVGRIRIDGTQTDDTFTLDYRGGDVIPTGGLIVDGTTGDNTLKIVGANSDLDLTGTGNAVVSNCEALDLSEPGTNRVLLDAAAIRSLAPTTSTLHVTADEKDQLIFPNSGDWRMADPIIVGTRFIVTANNNVAGGNERVESDNPRPWHNFVRASDVNNNGSVTASDALAGINELARGTFSNDDGMLRDPLEMTSWPGVYYDQNADGKLSALDLLRVINEMARLRNIIDLDNELIVPVSGLIASPITPGIVEESIDLVATQSLTKKLFDSRSNLVVFTDGQLVVSESKDENTGSQTPAKAIDALLSDEVFLDLLSGTGDAGLLMAG